MLTQSAVRMGARAVALDLYADADTRISAQATAVIAGLGYGFDGEALLAAANRLAPAAHYPLIYGSGLDTQPDLLDRLAQGRKLLGNQPATLRLCRSPEAFFFTLDQLGIPYPERCQQWPADPQNWLIKAGCSEGGKRVRFCAHAPAEADEYYQRRLTGQPLSVLFLADGRSAQIVGFNTQWTAARSERPFLFCGGINRAPLSSAQREQLRVYVTRLVPHLMLKGLNSLDFMLDDETCRILELNCRPSATMALYDADYPDGLLAAHIRACQGQLVGSGPKQHPVRGFRVIFAPDDIEIPDAFAWPDWCADRPISGSVIQRTDVLCTVEAEAASPASVEQLIQHRSNELIQRLGAAAGGHNPN
jgi:predicted ATP-grasp superfamily ATP-dependent carboligase